MVAATAKRRVAAPTMRMGRSAITGHAYFVGAAPSPQRFSVASDKACRATGDSWRDSESVIVNREGAVQNVFVYISAGLEDFDFSPPMTTAVLDQRECRFVPHVLGLQVGQPLRILNSDSTFHNVHGHAQKNAAFNLGMTRKKPERRRVFDTPEVMVPLRCNVHPWMIAYVGVVSNPFYAVTDSAGFFTLPSLPAGEYTLDAWHETAGTLSRTVKLGESETKTIDFTFHMTPAHPSQAGEIRNQ